MQIKGKTVEHEAKTSSKLLSHVWRALCETTWAFMSLVMFLLLLSWLPESSWQSRFQAKCLSRKRLSSGTCFSAANHVTPVGFWLINAVCCAHISTNLPDYSAYQINLELNTNWKRNRRFENFEIFKTKDSFWISWRFCTAFLSPCLNVSKFAILTMLTTLYERSDFLHV